MCGIAGFTLPAGLSAADRVARHGERLRRMTASLYHRGPDAQRAFLMDGAAFGHTRLSIVDLAAGHQPMRDEATGLTVVFNGEIFNHVELRERLAAGGYPFKTRCDTEVILAGFLAEGIDCVKRFVGQFAFALWDPRDRTLWLARDRVGIRPMYYARTREGLAFASEAKAIFAAGWLDPALDAKALKETLHLWAPVTPRSAFEGVLTLPPGHTARFDGQTLELKRYWDVDLSEENVDRAMTEKRALEELGEVLGDAVRLRLRADVPVAAYLSGGLDSSLICAMAQKQLGGTLQTFSVGFAQARYDEQSFQREVAAALKTDHRSVQVEDADIGALLPAVVEHTEQTLLRSAPAPFFKLSRLVLDHKTKVVLTGEGADEIFLGYDLFKETVVRQFWARQPRSPHRPKLFKRLYPYLSLSQQSPEMLQQFYGIGLESPTAFDFSHQIRWSNSGRVSRFLAEGFSEKVKDHSPAEAVRATLPAPVFGWRPLARAQYLEMQTLLSGYLLSAQGDRMLMSNSVEGRFPFLDHRVIEFAARVPAALKLKILNEKYLLKKFAEDKVPKLVTERTKFPYRAPIAEALTGAKAPQWSRELLTREAVNAVGVFDGAKVEKLVAKLGAAKPGSAPPSEADNMALVAVATTQLLAQTFLKPKELPRQRVEAVELLEIA
jgi:asparagine synthase (glutamine-hydrolysing)